MESTVNKWIVSGLIAFAVIALAVFLYLKPHENALQDQPEPLSHEPVSYERVYKFNGGIIQWTPEKGFSTDDQEPCKTLHVRKGSAEVALFTEGRNIRLTTQLHEQVFTPEKPVNFSVTEGEEGKGYSSFLRIANPDTGASVVLIKGIVFIFTPDKESFSLHFSGLEEKDFHLIFHE